MFGDSIFSWFKSSKQESAPEATWDPNTVTMTQPQSPAGPTTEGVVTGQPVRCHADHKLSLSYDANMNKLDAQQQHGCEPSWWWSSPRTWR
ncbi:uncharacterized protein AKAW2_10515A [Aspergillus luchuensis]|uniref:Uncharacterized protein n=1 Tax=Aspergillus kawachii TaxID=1069201 RepID=A0A7R7ZU81_ASPKA|nr:uncharacterized protein AKAW2_10515A [Aspergillus luchuensis]BCR93469.1 hypothetical protein AKAW2_10515A [Aspergillus luchuensis]